MLITGTATATADLDPVKLECYKAIAANAGIGYALDDEMVKVYNYNSTTGLIDTANPYFWLNTTTNLALTADPVLAEIERCDAHYTTEVEEKYDTNLTTGEITEIYEVVLFEANGDVFSTSYILADGTAAVYVPTGTVAEEPVRVAISGAVLAVANAAIGLVVPAFSSGAHLQVHTGNDVKVTTTGTSPVAGETGVGSVVRQGQEVILNSSDEINNFEIISIDATAGAEIYVEFFNTSIETGI